jgi:hypothetical protein
MTTLAPPASNLIDTDPWTISAVTNDILKVGAHQVTVTSSLQNYPGVPTKSVTFNLTVIDLCATALISNQDQVLNLMSYFPLTSTEPSVQKF